ncbi:MAG: hypothetical protein AB7U27_10565, partial [Aminobacteriaceae bacterium]
MERTQIPGRGEWKEKHPCSKRKAAVQAWETPSPQEGAADVEAEKKEVITCSVKRPLVSRFFSFF